MRAIVKGFVMWTLGLAVLVGSPAVSSAAPPPPVVPNCGCTCWWSVPDGKKEVSFTTDRSCSIYKGQRCYCNDQTCYLKYNAGVKYSGYLEECKNTRMKQAEPPAGAGGVKPPITPGQLQR